MRRLTVVLIIVAACSGKPENPNAGDPKRGKALLAQYGCTSCHAIPGVDGPKGMVGPPLDHIGSRQFIAGKFANTPQTMAQWLQNPQRMDPQNAMPNLGVTALDARDMTAYLQRLR